MRKHINAYYSTKTYDGGNSIKLNENGNFEFSEWNDYGWGTKGKGKYSISRNKLSLEFGKYDSLLVIIKPGIDSNLKTTVSVSVTPNMEFNLNCYSLTNNSKTVGCFGISNNEPTVITQSDLRFFNNQPTTLDSLELIVHLSQENMRHDSIQYIISKSDTSEYVKKLLYDDPQHRIKPQTKWNLKIKRRRIHFGDKITRILYRIKADYNKV